MQRSRSRLRAVRDGTSFVASDDMTNTRSTAQSASLVDTISTGELATITGAGWFRDGVDAVSNFTDGFVAGAVHGTGMTNEDTLARGLDRNATGTKPGVETGMMVNMALGPVGDALSLGASGIQSGVDWVSRQFKN